MENCLKTIHVSLTCENQPIKYLARDPRVDIFISLQLYHERNYTTMHRPDLIGRLPGISIWELHRQTYTNTTPVPCVCTICSPSCRIARKLLSIPTLDIALRWLADGLCVFTLPLEWTYWRTICLQFHIDQRPITSAMCPIPSCTSLRYLCVALPASHSDWRHTTTHWLLGAS